MQESNTKHLVIVGGGTSGWLSASFLASVLPETSNQAIEITLIESSDIPTIGVGEATTPSLKMTLATMGVSEFEFMRECDATFKHGIRFNQWLKDPSEDPNDYYFHPFEAPLRAGVDHSARHWMSSDASDIPYAQIAGVQQSLAESGYAPKANRSSSYEGLLSYAYHLDAGKLAVFLKKVGVGKKVNHLIDEVVSFDADQNNTITELRLKSGKKIAPDLIIDCTGFAARLINHDKTNPFVDKNHQLFCDSALATRIKHDGIDAIVPYTKSTAQKNGWIWDINLSERRGIGHVYSSKHSSEEEAAKDLAAYIGVEADQLEYRKLSMRIGYHQQQWRGNCIAIGLSAGFLEPLESTGIYLTEMAVWMLSQSVTRFFDNPEPTRNRFNKMMAHHFENIVDFIKLHYCLSERRDSNFWIENCQQETIPDSLKELLDRWQYDTPNDYDFDNSIQCFNSDNYQYVLYGMHFQKHHKIAKTSQLNEYYMTRLESKRNVLLERNRASLARNAKMMTKIISGANSVETTGEQMPSRSSNYRVR